MECRENVLIHGLECSEDKGVIRGCRGDAMGESGINDMDKH